MISSSRANKVPLVRPNVPRTPASLCAAAWASSCCPAERRSNLDASAAASSSATRPSISGRNRTHRLSRALANEGCWFGSTEGSLSAPAQHAGNLRGQRERVEWLEEYSLDAQVGKAALVGALHLGGQQQHRDARRGGILPQLAEGGWAVQSGHHDVQKNGVRLVVDGARKALRAGAGHDYFPAGHRLKAERGHLANVVFVIDN